MPDQYEVKVTVGDATVEVSGAQDGVVEIVKALSQILAGRTSSSAEPREATDRPMVTSPGRAAIDARSLFQQKAPSSQSEAIAVATYYVTELAPDESRAPSIDVARATAVFKQAKYPLPKRMSQSLVNTQNAGYLIRVGSGEYKLSPVGFNLVEHTLGPNG